MIVMTFVRKLGSGILGKVDMHSRNAVPPKRISTFLYLLNLNSSVG